MAQSRQRKPYKPKVPTDEQINTALMKFYTGAPSQRTKLAERLVSLSRPGFIKDPSKAIERRSRYQQALVLLAQAKFEEKPTPLRAKKFAFKLGKYRRCFRQTYFEKLRKLAYGAQNEHKKEVERELASIGASQY